jgi:CYTH domain-containing protein
MENKYARIERERRFLLRQLPADLDQSQFTLIEDRYIEGTRLRLRKMSAATGQLTAVKFGHKFTAPGQPAQQTMMTNFYLNEAEYELLATLPGKRLLKKRFKYGWHGRHFSIDQFQNGLEGLILAEIEAVNDEDLNAVPVPDFALREGTAVTFFTGGNLVEITVQALNEKLASLAAE